jgi:hypothetical protein
MAAGRVPIGTDNGMPFCVENGDPADNGWVTHPSDVAARISVKQRCRPRGRRRKSIVP